jgi:4-amino-4-deoxy-L-arabinose transferase-like glycosyltransferase
VSAAPGRWQLPLAAVAFAVLAAALLALYWLPEAKLLAGDERAFYQPAALALLAGGDWFDRQMLWPPLQVLFLAALFALPGPDILAVQLVQLALLAGAGWLLRGLWLALTGDRVAAGWAGVLLAVNPLTIAFATYLWPEIVHLFLSLALARLLLAARRAPTRGRSVALAAAAGVAAGLCLLSKSLLTAFWPLLVLALVLRTPWPAAALRAAAFMAAMLLVTAPALLRGAEQTGRAQIADSSWFNLWTGLADRYRSDLVDDQTGPRLAAYLASAPDHAGRVAFARAQAQALVESQGLAATVGKQLGTQYFRLFDARNFLVAQLPGPACRGYNSHYTLPPSALSRAIDYGARAWHLALLVLFALGLAAWRDWRAPWLWLTAAFVGYQLALFLGLHVKSRFLLPMLPVICMFAGHLLAQLPQSGLASSPLPPWRRALGLALAAILVVLALAGPVLDQACA